MNQIRPRSASNHPGATREHVARRRAAAAFATVNIGISALTPIAAIAYPTPGPNSSNGAPARFMPAPNELTYCESVDYFGPWSKNVALWEDSSTDLEPTIDQDGDGDPTNDVGRQSVISDTATTGPTEITATFDRMVAGGYNARIQTPAVFDGSHSDLGIILDAPAESKVTLSEPMFYSQWVFTDVDSNNEGFDIVPTWATTGNDILLSSASKTLTTFGDDLTMTFVENGDHSADGYQLNGRVQTDFLGAITGFDFTKRGPSSAGSGFVGGAGCLPVGVSKSASEPVYDPNTGTFTVQYSISVRNSLPDSTQLRFALETAIVDMAGKEYKYLLTGLPEGIDETVLQITDSLESPGFSDVAISNVQGTGLTPNPAFDGSSETNLLAGTDTLAPQTTGTVSFTATYTPDISHDAWDDCSNEVSNSATASAQAQGIDISDASDAGTNPIPTNNNGDGSTDDPTRVEFDLGCGLSLDKGVGSLTTDADGSEDISAGDTVTYTVTATNTGGGDLDNVVVTDPAISPASRTCAVVAPGATCILTGTYVITDTDVGAGQKANTASAKADQVEPVSDASVTPIGKPAMLLAKSAGKLTGDADSSGDISAGDTVTYTVTATNSGTANLTDITVSDPLLTMTPDPFVCAGPVSPGETCVATGTYVITADDVDAGTRDNTASATADQIATAVSASSTTPIGRPKLTVDKSPGTLTDDADGSGDISAGDTLTYTVTAANTGTAALTGLTISDPGVTFPSNPYACPSPLAPTKTCTATGTYLVTQDDVAAGFKKNTATADADQSPAVTDSSTTAIPFPKLELAKATPTLSADADSSGDISVGDTLSYEVTATNAGRATLTDVVVSDAALTPGSATCATVAVTGTCVLTGTHVVTADDIADGRIDNTAAAVSDQTSEVTASRSVAAPIPGAVLTKSAPALTTDADTSGDISAGDTLSYTVRLTNTGAANLTDIALSDPRLTPNGATCAGPVAPGEVCELTGTLVVTSDDLAAGAVVNTASGTSDQTPEVTAERSTPLRSPKLTIVKSDGTLETDADASGDLSAGDEVRFTITATNTGTANLTEVVVTDNRITPASATCDGPVAPSATCVLTGLYTVTASDVTSGTFSNTATADSAQSPQVSDGVDIELGKPELSLTKSEPTNSDEDESGDISVGDTLTYTVTAANVGTANLTDVTVSDSLVVTLVDECDGVTLLVEESCEFIGTHTVTADDVAARQIDNVATGDAAQTAEVTDEVTVPINTPQLEITKSEAANADEDGSGDVSVGDTLSYTVTATNVGGASLTNVEVADPKLAGDGTKTCAGPLTTGETCELTGIHVVTAADITAGAFTNTATASSTQAPDVSATVVTPAPAPAMTLIKEFTSNADEDGSEDFSVGDSLTYTVTATNVGAANLTDITVSDPHLSPATKECAGPVAKGGTCVLTGTYRVSADDVETGSIENTARASAVQVATMSDSVTLDIPAPALAISKKSPSNADEDGSGDISVGDTLTYTITATNVGSANLTDVVIDDEMLDPASKTCSGPLSPGQICELQGTYTVAAADVAAGTIVNVAVADSSQTGEVSDERIAVVPEPLLGLVKSEPTNADEDGSGDVSVGDTLTYTVTATNTGQAVLTDVVVNDEAITPASATCDGPLGLGETCVLTGTYSVSAADVAAGSIANSATATSTQAPTVTDDVTIPVRTPTLSIDKPAPVNADEDGSGDVSVGDTLTYTVTATNAGQANLTGVVVTDALISPASATCDGPLSVGKTCVLTGTYAVTAADVTAGRIANTATADSVQTAQVSAERVVPVAKPALSIDKPAPVNADEDGSGDVSVGDTLTYTITATNTGTANLTDLVVTDARLTPSSTTCEGPARPAETCVLTGTYVVTGADVTAGSIANSATASSTQAPDVTDEVTVDVTTPLLAVDKPAPVNADEDGSGDVSAGDTLTYTITATNTGTANLTGVALSDELLTPDAKTCEGPLSPKQVCVLTGTYRVTSGDVAAGAITNTASARSVQTPTAVTDGVEVGVDQPALSVAKAVPVNADEDGSGDVSAGDTLTYTVTATNTGEAALTDVTVADPMITPGTTSCEGPLRAGETCVLTGTYVVGNDDVTAGRISNTATADSAQTAQESTERIIVVPDPLMSVDKPAPVNADEDGSGDVSAGDTLTYTITATNLGTANLTGVEVTDPLIAPDTATCEGPIATGETCVLTGTYAVTAADVAAGRIPNTATASSRQTEDVTDAWVVVVPDPLLGIDKPAPINADEDGSGDVSAGDTLTYTITATNLGTANLTGVVVSDALITPDSTTCEGVLRPAQTCVLTGTYSVTSGDVAAGSLTNSASATSPQTPDPVIDEVEIGINQPALELDKSIPANTDEDESADVSVGDTLTYTVRATNTGSANLTDVVLVDDLISPNSVTCPGPIPPGGTCELEGAYTVTADDVAARRIANVARVDSAQTEEDSTERVIGVPDPLVSIDKPAPVNADEDGSGDVSVGDTLTYTITATNVGTANLTDVVITDPLVDPESMACPGPVRPGEACALSGTYVVTNDDVASGQIRNTAAVESDQTAAIQTERTVAVPDPLISVDKPAPVNADEDSSGDVSAGDTLTYTITATNVGTANLTGVVVTDSKITPESVTCESPWAPGATCVLTGSYTVTPGDVAAGWIKNAASATSIQTPDAVTDRMTVGLKQPALSVDKPAPTNADEDGSGDLSVGDTLTYTVTASNTGEAALTNVVVSDPMIEPGTAECSGPMGTGETCELTGTYVVTAEDVAAGRLVNTARARADQAEAEDVERTVVVPDPVLGVVKAMPENADEDGSGDVSVGDTLTYAVTGTNLGTANLTNVVVEDEMISPDAAACKGPVLPGETCVLTGVYSVTADDVASGRLANTATARSDQSDTVSDSVTISATSRIDLVVSKEVDRPTASLGEEVIYTITVANLGPAPAPDVVVVDEAPDGLALESFEPSIGAISGAEWRVGELAAGETASLRVVARVEAAGTVTNLASAQAFDDSGEPIPEGDTDNNADSADIEVAAPEVPPDGGLPSSGAQLAGVAALAVLLLAGGGLVIVARRGRRRE